MESISSSLPSIESKSVAPLLFSCASILYATYWTCSYVCNIDRYLYRGTQVAVCSICLAHLWLATRSSGESHAGSSSLVEQFLIMIQSWTGGSPVARLVIGDVCFFLLCGTLVHGAGSVRRELSLLTRKQILNHLGSVGLSMIRRIPILARKVETQMSTIESVLKDALKKEMKDEPRTLALPTEGKTDAEILAFLTRLSGRENLKWASGKVSGAVYHGEADHLEMLNQAYSLYSVSNPLHADIWPSIVKFEAEIISMTANLLSGGGTLC